MKLISQFINTTLLRRIMSLVKPYKNKFYLALIIAVIMAALSIVNPQLIQKTVDDYILKNNLHMLWVMAGLILLSLIIQATLSYQFTFSTNQLGQNIIKDLRLKVFNHLLKLNLRYFDKTPIGTSTTRTISDVEAINDIFSEGIITIFSDLLTIIAVLGIMFYNSWQLTLISLTVLPLLLIAAYVFKEGIRKTFTEVRNQVARLNTFMQEHISGMLVVQVFNAEESEMKKFEEINAAHRGAHIKSNWYYSIFFPVVEIISALALGLLLWLWGKEFIQQQATVGLLVSFIMYINMLFRPIRMLADKFNTLQMGMVASERVFKVIDTNEIIQDNGTDDASSINGSIKFQDVSFSYDGINQVLKKVNFHVNAGQTLAIVGATGAGKTSIISLLNRLYEINEGEILVDDKNVRQYNLDSLRRQIGLVMQDVFLFSGTVFENITLMEKHISKEMVEKAAKICGAHEFIIQLPGQYEYKVMERGSTLSMGQRQLISFVRAMVFNPKILVLDEATASIDSNTETLIQLAIEKLVSNRTSIIIAHRLSTILHADQIMVMHKGEVKEMGTHQELLSLNAYYRKLYDMQFEAAESVKN